MPITNVKFVGLLLDEKTMLFDQSITVDSMLKTFLNETNSPLFLDTEKILFMFKGRVLNMPKFLNKNLSEVFKSDKAIIKVTDCDNMVGRG